MTVDQAAEQWLRTNRRIKKLEIQRQAARERLLEHFRKTGRQDYKGRVGYAKQVRTQLDQKKVKAFLSDKVGRFLKQSTAEILSPLE